LPDYGDYQQSGSQIVAYCLTASFQKLQSKKFKARVLGGERFKDENEGIFARRSQQLKV
jgi:hypothetical protein